jgi:hypothetical protein
MKTFFIILFLFLTDFSFAQSEYQYYENHRLERLNNKIKSVSYYSNDDKNPYEIKYYSEDGNPLKFENYNTDNTLHTLTEITNIDTNGLISFIQTVYFNESPTHKFSRENISPSEFYDIGFGDNEFSRVKYVFGPKNLLTEKIFISVDYDSTKPFQSVKFFYDDNGKLDTSQNLSSDNSLLSKTYYFYNSQGLLEKKIVKFSNPEVNKDHKYIYKYEFYK